MSATGRPMVSSEEGLDTTELLILCHSQPATKRCVFQTLLYTDWQTTLRSSID
jgi:hypothetical protein